MRVRLVLSLAAIVAIVLAAPAETARQRGGHAFVLTVLADQGTVYWRPCSDKGWSLGFRIWTVATAGVTFRAGSLSRRRTAQPGEATIWFPFNKSRVQRLSVVSGGAAETIYSRVKVEFDEPHSLPNCFPYAPPRVSVSLYGKDHFS